MAVLKFRHKCDTCKGVGNKLYSVQEEERPGVGDLSVCSNCSTIGRFTHEGDINLLVALTLEEVDKIRRADPSVFDEMLKGWQSYRRRD